MRVEQGKEGKKNGKKKNESEIGLKRPVVTFLSFPSKDLRLW